MPASTPRVPQTAPEPAEVQDPPEEVQPIQPPAEMLSPVTLLHEVAAAPPEQFAETETSVEPNTEPLNTPPPLHSVPSFTRPTSENKVWRIPLVSSFLVTTVGVILLHYL